LHDPERAKAPINFIQNLKLTDEFFGQKFYLMDWQIKILSEVYGTVNEKGYRQYNYAYLEIPKKNAKTTTIAALAVYHLYCDGNEGQIYCCAADRGQATLVYKAALSMIEQDKWLKQTFKITDSRKEIKNIKTGTILKVLSAEAYSKHGLNPSVVIFDELHAQPNRELWDVMTFGAGAARKEPLWWVITTAGDDPDRHSIGWEIHEYARQIMQGEKEDPSWFARIFCADEDDDIWNEKTWYKANPSLGITIDIDAVRKEALTARNSPSMEKNFRWLRLNQWVSLKQTGWLDLTLWDTTVGNWSLSELVGKKCYAGLDLSSTVDLTGLVLLFPPQDELDEWRFVSEAWIPEENMKERILRDHVPYDRWVNEKYLTATPGNVVDYDFVKARIETISKQYSLNYLCTDPWNSRMLTQQLEKCDIETIEVQQNMAKMSPAMKEIERLMKSGAMTHERNPLARWSFGNVNVAVDGNGNIKPMKNKSRDRIDPTVALINAMAVAITQENMEICVYNNRAVGEKIFSV
jgi:phage terminase large subunit-like protein